MIITGFIYYFLLLAIVSLFIVKEFKKKTGIKNLYLAKVKGNCTAQTVFPYASLKHLKITISKLLNFFLLHLRPFFYLVN